MMSELLDTVIDICSSGQGCEGLEEWHIKELKKVFNKNLRSKVNRDWFFAEFVAFVNNSSDGWTLDDVNTIKELLKIEGRIKVVLDVA